MGGGLSKKVLLIDDDPDVHATAKVALELVNGWSVFALRDGTEAVSMALAHGVDLVLLDMLMPKVDGTDVLAALRADDRTRDLPVVFLTAATRPDLHALADRLGAQGVIEKPFHVKTLGEAIERLVGS